MTKEAPKPKHYYQELTFSSGAVGPLYISTSDCKNRVGYYADINPSWVAIPLNHLAKKSAPKSFRQKEKIGVFSPLMTSTYLRSTYFF